MAMSRSFGAMSFTMRSPILMFPLVISSKPARQRKAVVLPQPEGPTSTRNSLSATSIFKLLTAVTSPYFLTTFSNATLAMGLSSVSWEYGDSIILLLAHSLHESTPEFQAMNICFAVCSEHFHSELLISNRKPCWSAQTPAIILVCTPIFL